MPRRLLWLVIGLVGAGLIVLILWAVVVVPPLLIDVHEIADPAKRLDEVNSFRTTLAGVLGGLAVIAGAAVGALGLRETQRQNRAIEKQNRDVLDVQRRGQVTERFTRAIELLGQRGDDKLDARLGAIYALEQIALDSTELHWPIMEVLSAYLREHGSSTDQPFDPHFPIDLPFDPRFRIPSDHQAIVTVISRRNAKRDRAGQHLNLRRVDLRVADLRGANLRAAHLMESLLMRADFEGADLEGALLIGAHLERANLQEAHLERAHLEMAFLNAAWMGGVHLEGATAAGANLEGALLSDDDRRQLEGQQGYGQSRSEQAPEEVNPDLRERLDAAIKEFHRYVVGLRLAPAELALPLIHLDPSVRGSFYDSNLNRIQIHPDLAENPHLAFREYCNFALSLDDPSVDFVRAAYDLMSALAFYLPCSYTGNPAAFKEYGYSLDDTNPMISRRGSPGPAHQQRAHIWGSIFWQVRSVLGKATGDHLIAAAWLATVSAAANEAKRVNQSGRAAYRVTEELFVTDLLELLPAQVEPLPAQSLRDILVQRRVLAKPAAAKG